MFVFGFGGDKAIVGRYDRFGNIFSREASSSCGVTGVKDQG